MSKPQYPGFHGWTVERNAGPNGRHEFLFRKDHPEGKDGKLTVWSTGGDGADPMIAYLAGKRDALAEDIRVSTEDDRALWQERFDAVNREIIAGKVQRHIPKMRERGESEADVRTYAIGRLDAAGYSLTETAKILDSVPAAPAEQG
jgi:hypothetical protein